MLTHIGTENLHMMCLMLCNQCNNITISRQFWNKWQEFSLRMVQYVPKHVGEIW